MPPNSDGAPGLFMLSISQIAERDGVSKPTVSQKVAELVAKHGLRVERDGRGRVSAVDVAQYDHLRGRFGDPFKAQAPQPPKSAAPAFDPESLDEAQRKKAWYEAHRRGLELDELRGDLVRRQGIETAISVIGAEIAAIVDRLAAQADDFAAAVGRDGPHGLRVALRAFASQQRADIADVMARLSNGAPLFDGELVEDAA
ncbi:ArsR family transcriptional regulator [Labrys wisconsinensis]|uniref:DNA-binding transcriptional ArsR family regulator n=1 Tax=Labrys wisconsinensis TaxID=425677 RepID=A0ABU0JEV5_9HYPH|nr:ArsR family transcriptional regulator [Labrys wisconsinensis]MDQ0472804.1 DNA-binding transcriptional ArsR family regulator [Labrys wisconsinensis]